MRRSALSACAVAALAAFTWTSPAHAIEKQHHFGLSPTLSILKVDDKSTLSVGGGGGIHYAYGLTDQFNLMAEGNFSIVALDQQQDYPEAPRNRPAVVDHVSVGLGYVIDILRWVPYVSAIPGLYHLAGGTLDSSVFAFGASLGVGLDYQLSRQWAVGIAGRQHFILTKMSDYPSYTTIGLRLEYMWGY